MDELMLDVGQANEFKLAFRRAGYTNADVKKLCEGELLAQLLPVVRGHGEVVVAKHIIDCDRDPLIPYDGWKVECHHKGGQVEWDPNKVAFYLSAEQKNGRIVGNKLRKEVEKQSPYNANLLDYLLDHPLLIPDEWKVDENGNTRYIYFWGTVYRLAGDSLYVRCLCFHGGHWGSGYGYVGGGFDASDPTAVRAS